MPKLSGTYSLTCTISTLVRTDWTEQISNLRGRGSPQLATYMPLSFYYLVSVGSTEQSLFYSIDLRGRGSPHKEKAFLPLCIGLSFCAKAVEPPCWTLPGVWLSEPGEDQLAVKNGVQRESLRSQPIGSRLKWFQSYLPVRICYLATFHCHTAHCNRAVLPSLLP